MSTWREVLGPLTRREQVAPDLMRWAMGEIMGGTATPAQIGGFLLALRTRGETAEDINALVDVMLQHSQRLNVEGNAIDIVGTGGDLAHTVNISTMASIVMATAGARVVKHGNRAASSKCGTADVLEALGVRIDLDPAGAAAMFAELSLTFCFAATFHPAMRYAGPPRRELGVPTVFNFLGPLANPAQPNAALIGVADMQMAPLMAEVLRTRGVHALVVRGDDGLDEVSVCAPSTVWKTWGGELEIDAIDPTQLGIALAAPDALRGGDAAFNADVLRRVMAGERAGALAPVVDAVALNAAAADVAWRSAQGQAIGDLHSELASSLDRMRAVLASGAAERTLDAWIAASSRIGG